MDPPKPVPINMRQTKLKASEAALIAGELVKPTWASRNEGIHERISFEDTLWGFEMAGGAYYKTPLRVVYVRPGSRAEHACIRMGDTVLRISGQDTSNLTLQEAHQLVLEAGINLKIVVTSPDDKVNAHYDYQDPLNEDPGLSAEKLKEMELERVRKALERASRCRELPWPWVRKNWVIYRESNCFMVPSKYENKHKDKFPELPAQQLNNFFPAEKINQQKHSKKVEVKENNSKKDEIEKIDAENDDEEFQEVEEEIEEEQEVENEQESSKQEDNERLEDKTTQSHETEHKNASTNQNENNDKGTNDLKQDIEILITDDSLEDSQRKNSVELDTNNNHVVKSKDEQANEESRNENNSDDQIINEIVDNTSGLVDVEENVAKSDDDIIDSVLNEHEDSNDSQNGR